MPTYNMIDSPGVMMVFGDPHAGYAVHSHYPRGVDLFHGITPSSHVRGGTPVRVGRPGGRSPETLCRELVSMGKSAAGEGTGNLYERIVSQVVKELILQVLKSCQGVQTKAAVRLGINRNTLHKKIEEYGLESEGDHAN
ncbi:MAG: hypothetical protein JSS02_21885 [Planctomycetes bacterium]|nr:hypothetical protein [Planctomycetota bacterium]